MPILHPSVDKPPGVCAIIHPISGISQGVDSGGTATPSCFFAFMYL